MSRASECRDWLRQNPGWHFSSDVLDALGKKGWKERQPYAWALRNAAELGMLAMQGTGKAIRYCYVHEPKREARGGWIARVPA